MSTRFWDFGSGNLNPSLPDSQQLSFPFQRGRMRAGYGSSLICKNNVRMIPGMWPKCQGWGPGVLPSHSLCSVCLLPPPPISLSHTHTHGAEFCLLQLELTDPPSKSHWPLWDSTRAGFSGRGLCWYPPALPCPCATLGQQGCRVVGGTTQMHSSYIRFSIPPARFLPFLSPQRPTHIQGVG